MKATSKHEHMERFEIDDDIIEVQQAYVELTGSYYDVTQPKRRYI